MRWTYNSLNTFFNLLFKQTKHLLEKATESSAALNQSTAEQDDQDKRASTALLSELNALRDQIAECHRNMHNKDGDLTKIKVER